VVHDPVMNPTGGKELAGMRGINYVSAELLKRSNVITPNIAEPKC